MIEYSGPGIQQLSMEGRMTLCNMSIEGGARAGMIAPDDKTFEYLKERPFAPTREEFGEAVAYWRTLPSDPDAEFDLRIQLDANTIAPQVTWGTNPGMVSGIDEKVPDPLELQSETERGSHHTGLGIYGP